MSENSKLHQDIGSLRKGQEVLEKRSVEHSLKLDRLQENMTQIANNTAQIARVIRHEVDPMQRDINALTERILMLEELKKKQKWLIIGASSTVGALASTLTFLMKWRPWEHD